MTMSNILATDVVVSILVSVYSHKYRADYTIIHYTEHTTHYTLQTKRSQMVPFLIAGLIWYGTINLAVATLYSTSSHLVL